MSNEVWAVGEDGEAFRLKHDKKWEEIDFDKKFLHVSAGGSGKQN